MFQSPSVVPWPMAVPRGDLGGTTKGTRRKNFFSLVTFFLVDTLDRQFDLVGLFVGVELFEGLNVAGHDRGAGFDAVLLFDLLAGILAPFDRLLLRVLVVVGEVENVGALELEGADAGDFELTAVEALFGKAGNGFVGSSVNNLVYLSLDGFLLDAQGAQGF